MERYLRTYARIDLEAILHNINEVKKRIEKKVKIMAVIKADGYGHGAAILGNFLENEVDYYGVATIEEAMELRKCGINLPILILGYTSPSQFVELVENNARHNAVEEKVVPFNGCAKQTCKNNLAHFAFGRNVFVL